MGLNMGYGSVNLCGKSFYNLHNRPRCVMGSRADPTTLVRLLVPCHHLLAELMGKVGLVNR